MWSVPRLSNDVPRITESSIESTRTEEYREYKDENGTRPSDL
jgi:hypothetical protein